MRLIKRIVNFFRSEANAALDSMEDPMKMFDMKLADLIEKRYKIESELASIIANIKICNENISEINENISKQNSLADAAAKQGDTEAVRTFAMEIRRLEDDKVRQETVLKSLEESESTARNLYNKICDSVNELVNRKNIIHAKLMAADAAEIVNDIAKDFNTDSGNSVSSIESVADRKLVTQQAISELRGENKLKEYEERYSTVSIDDMVNEIMSRNNNG